MKFSTWLENRLMTEGGKKGGSNPVQMPKPESNVVKPSGEAKQRVAGGRKDTSFDPRPNRLRTRSATNRRAIEEN